jgi:ATP-binding cassette subfamily B protein
VRRYAVFGLAWRAERDLRMRLVAPTDAALALYDRAQTGQLMAYNTDIQQINNVVLLIPLTLASSIQMVAVAVILLLRSPGLAFFALAALPLLNISATRFSHRMFPVGLALQEELSELSGVVEESVTGIRIVKGFGVERMQHAASGVGGKRKTSRWSSPGCPPTSCPSSTSCPPSGWSASSGSAATKCSTGT